MMYDNQEEVVKGIFKKLEKQSQLRRGAAVSKRRSKIKLKEEKVGGLWMNHKRFFTEMKKRQVAT